MIVDLHLPFSIPCAVDEILPHVCARDGVKKWVKQSNKFCCGFGPTPLARDAAGSRRDGKHRAARSIASGSK